MKQPQEVSALIAFAAGFLSFISPCVLPLVPSYITYITGVSFHELTDQETKKKVSEVDDSHPLLSFYLGILNGLYPDGSLSILLGTDLEQVSNLGYEDRGNSDHPSGNPLHSPDLPFSPD